MSVEPSPGRLRAIHGGRADDPEDARVAAVLDVLGGEPSPVVAKRWSVDPALLGRWVRAFVDAGTAQVSNQPGEQAARQRDRFLAAFAHEMRTPLSVAKGWAAMLQADVLPAASVPKILDQLSGALERLTERTIDVELLAACSLGRLRTKPSRTTVAQLCAGLVDPAQVGGDGADVELEVDPEHFPRLLRDLWQAGSSTPRPRSLRLETERLDLWVEIRVVRDADPIDTAVLQALFDPFDLNDDGTGVTIGLYLARALAVAHGGSIGVEQDEHHAVLWVRVPQRRTTPTPTSSDV